MCPGRDGSGEVLGPIQRVLGHQHSWCFYGWGRALRTSPDPSHILKSSVGPPRMKGLWLPFYSCCYYRHINRSPPTPLSLCFTASHRDCDLSWPLVRQLHGAFQRGCEKKRGEFSKTPERIFFVVLCPFKVVSSRHTIAAAAIVKHVAYPSKPLLSPPKQAVRLFDNVLAWV